MNRLTTTLAIAIGAWFISTPLVVADVFDLTLLPDSGIISGPAGSTIGWGYSITNNTTDWIQTENVSGGVFTNTDPASPGFIFDFPAIAPLSTVSTPFAPVNTLACPAAPCGLFELIWSGAAPGGSSNTGTFILSADLYDGDPSLGGNDLGAAPDASASYEADVTNTAVTPEPGYWLTALLILAAIIGFLIRRKRAATHAAMRTSLAVLVALAALAPGARAADVYQVNTATDIGGSVAQCTGSLPCSLRGAISLVNSMAQGTPGYTATIQVPSGTYTLSQTHFCGAGEQNTIPLCMDANVNLSIVGAGAASTIINGNQMGQVFILNNVLGNIKISGVTITNGCGRGENCAGVSPFTLTFVPGGGIYSIGTLTVADCVITLNFGSGIYHSGASFQQLGGTLSVFRTTFSNNSGGDGSAIQDLAGGAVTIVDSTFTGNFTNSCCGTIDNNTGGQGAPGAMTITGSTFTGNSGNGTINNGGILTITNSTIAGNTSGSYGGGINTGSGSLLFLYNDTIYGNTSTNGAGGVNGDVAAMANTIIAGNSSLSGQPDCLTPGQAGNSIVSQGYNLIQNPSTCTITGVTTGDIPGQSPMLGTLASNGGPTRTMAPAPGSPTIGAGNPALPGGGNGACASIDQRGITRKASRICDIGAFQTGGPLAVTAISPAAVANSGTAVEVVSGNAFAPLATVRLSRAGQPDIPGNPVTVDPGEAELAASFNLAGQAFGAWDVVVSNPDGSSATLPGGFLVQAPQAPFVTTDIVGPGVVRDNSKGTVNVVINNPSNTDAYGVVVGIQVLNTFALAPGFPMLTPPFQPGQVAQDWTQVPIVVDQSKPINFYPFFLPFVPAGYSGSLPFTITYPQVKGQGESGGIAPAFVIAETSTAPELNPTLSPAITSLLVTGAQIFSQAGGVTIAASAAPAMQAYLANQYNVAVQSAISSVVTNGGVRLPGYSLSQLQFDLALYGASQPGSTPVATQSQAVARSRMDTSGNVRFSPANCQPGTSCGNEPTPIGPGCSAVGGSFVGFFGGGVSGGGGGCGNGGGGAPGGGSSSFLNGLFQSSLDPNSKVGPRGASASQYLSGTSSLDYIVGFSNEPTAGLPAQTVVATDQLDTTKVDPSTFALGPITVAGLSVTPPPGTQQYSTTIDLRPANNLLVRADAGINGTGLVTWTFTSLDPATLQLTANGLVGFLPADTNPPNGEAQMLFTVKQRAGLATGTAVQNQATVVFDTNAAMITPVWTNLIDATAPQSKVLPLNPSQTTVTFPVQWSGTDAGSGIASYSIFSSQNGGAYTPWLTQTGLTSANFTGQPGQNYAFYSSAEDAVGNVEAAHLTADAVTSVTVGTPRITATITDSGQASGSFYLDLKVTESGTAAVTNVLLSQITAKTLTGTGTVTFNAALSGALPASVGSLAVGGSQTVRLFFTVPAGVKKFSLTENGTLQVPGGAAASFSASQVVIL